MKAPAKFDGRSVCIIGAPSSAGAYAPGQEQAPAALRRGGLVGALREVGLEVTDLGDVEQFRWRPDPDHPHAMNVDVVASVADQVAQRVASVLDAGRMALVLGGDCSVELGTVAGARQHSDSVGLIYIDLDADLNVPASTVDGALDWMVVAHLLGIPGTDDRLAHPAGRDALLEPENVILFGTDRITNFESEQIVRHGIKQVSFDEVSKNPADAAASVVDDWAGQFDTLLVHLDVDILDYVDFPIAESVRRGCGLQFEQLNDAMQGFLRAPNLAALTITEVNPTHCDEGQLTIRHFVESVAEALGSWTPLTDTTNIRNA